MTDKEIIKKKTPFGLGGVLAIYFEQSSKNQFYSLIKKLIRGYAIPLIVCIVAFYLITQSEEQVYKQLITVSALFSNILPNLLGFNLGAYALFTGFGGASFLKKIVSYKQENYSLYQKNSAIFALSIIMQAFTLFFCVIIDIFSGINIDGIPVRLTNTVNELSLFFTLLFGFISVWIMISLVINIFNLSQKYHFILFGMKSE